MRFQLQYNAGVGWVDNSWILKNAWTDEVHYTLATPSNDPEITEEEASAEFSRTGDNAIDIEKGRCYAWLLSDQWVLNSGVVRKKLY